MSWSPQQQAMLSAMGYTLYHQVGVAAVMPMAQVPAALTSPASVGERAGIAPAAADRLLKALGRAAGGRDPAVLPLPPLEQLRASAAAKRALWPVLRALRRQR